MSAQRPPVESGQAFVLHAIAWRETSQIIELFTRQHGRVPVVAKGVRRARSALRGVLQPFQPLGVSWFGQGELRTLKSAEWQGGIPLLQGRAIFCGFYLNELLLKLVVRDDPHEGLFDIYTQAIQRLSEGDALEPVLRSFEVSLLRELGYALPLQQEADSHKPIDPGANYRFEVERGPVRLREGEVHAVQLSGKTLLDMAESRYEDPLTLNQSKQLMRLLLAHHLGHQDLHTRRIIQELPSL